MRLPLGRRTATLAVTLLGVLSTVAALMLLGSPSGAAAGTRPALSSGLASGARPAATSPKPEPGLTLGISGALGQLTQDGSADATWTARAHHVGAQIIRLDLDWSTVAPATRPAGFDAADPDSPGYDWTSVDDEVTALTDEGFAVFISINSAPSWAQGAGAPKSAAPGTWKPNAADLGAFATAIATRYDGHTADPADPGTDLPRVAYWQVWNEPNLTQYLAPQWVKSGRSEVAESPTIYRELENAFYTAVTAVSASNFVVAAGTAPYGDPPGGQRMSPVTFDRHLLCLNAADKPTGSCPSAVKMDAIDDHPYVSGLCCEGPTWHAALPDDTALADVYKIVDVLKGAEKAHTVAPAGGHQKVWTTEIGWNTDPPNPNRREASPVATVGRWATQALYVLWSQGVSTVLWYQLADDPESSQGWAATFTEGLYYAGGGAKPAAAALAFPFLTNRRTDHSVEAWGRAPRAGTLSIQIRRGRRWKSIRELKVSADEVFEAPIALTGRASYRAVVDGVDSPAWSQSA